MQISIQTDGNEVGGIAQRGVRFFDLVLLLATVGHPELAMVSTKTDLAVKILGS